MLIVDAQCIYALNKRLGDEDAQAHMPYLLDAALRYGECDDKHLKLTRDHNHAFHATQKWQTPR